MGGKGRKRVYWVFKGNESGKRKRHKKMRMKREMCILLGSRRMKRGRERERMPSRKELWLVPHEGMGDFVSCEDHMLGLMQTRSEHVTKGMVFFVKCKGRGRRNP